MRSILLKTYCFACGLLFTGVIWQAYAFHTLKSFWELGYSLLTLIGLLGYSFEKRIFSQLFWKIGVLFSIGSEFGQTLFQIAKSFKKIQFYQLSLYIGPFNIYFYFSPVFLDIIWHLLFLTPVIPLYIFNYRYAFKARHIWEETPHSETSKSKFSQKL